MPMSTDITLPRDVRANWPERCVGCGDPRPGGSVHISTRSIGWWTWAFWGFGSSFAVDVPACPACGRRLRRTRVVRTLVTWTVALAGVAVAFWILDAYHGPLRKWLAMLIALACLMPLVLWEVFFPPLFDITCYAKTVDYEFRDPDYAMEFESMNCDEASDPEVGGDGPQSSQPEAELNR